MSNMDMELFIGGVLRTVLGPGNMHSLPDGTLNLTVEALTRKDQSEKVSLAAGARKMLRVVLGPGDRGNLDGVQEGPLNLRREDLIG